jgi:hypothetical protein
MPLSTKLIKVNCMFSLYALYLIFNAGHGEICYSIQITGVLPSSSTSYITELGSQYIFVFG